MNRQQAPRRGSHQHGITFGDRVLLPNHCTLLRDMTQRVLILLPPSQVGEPQEQIARPPLPKLFNKQVPASARCPSQDVECSNALCQWTGSKSPRLLSAPPGQQVQARHPVHSCGLSLRTDGPDAGAAATL